MKPAGQLTRSLMHSFGYERSPSGDLVRRNAQFQRKENIQRYVWLALLVVTIRYGVQDIVDRR